MNNENFNNSYFITLSNNPEAFVHYNNDKGYFVGVGTIGACMFRITEALEFLKEFEHFDNLTMVKVRDVFSEAK
jgi:hypothetical protein